MIVGYHIIFGTYGFWLPNDPRGSWSDFVGSWELFRYGKATKTDATHSVAHVKHDREARLNAKSALKYPPVVFDGLQARAVGRGFAEYFEKSDTIVRACAIMPDHVHLVTGPLSIKAEQLSILLKGSATRQLVAEGIHPMLPFVRRGTSVPKCFAQGEWKVYLDPDDVERAIRYVQNNPMKEGFKAQNWGFVKSRPIG